MSELIVRHPPLDMQLLYKPTVLKSKLLPVLAVMTLNLSIHLHIESKTHHFSRVCIQTTLKKKFFPNGVLNNKIQRKHLSTQSANRTLETPEKSYKIIHIKQEIWKHSVAPSGPQCGGTEIKRTASSPPPPTTSVFLAQTSTQCGKQNVLDSASCPPWLALVQDLLAGGMSAFGRE